MLKLSSKTDFPFLIIFLFLLASCVPPNGHSGIGTNDVTIYDCWTNVLLPRGKIGK